MRKKYFIDKSFQTKIILRVVFIVMLTVVISGFISYRIALHLEKKSPVQLYGATNDYGDDVVSVSRLDVIKPVIYRSLFIGGTVSIILAAVLMFFYSHRIAGPLYHMKKHLEGIIKNDTGEKLTFRKKDEFKELAAAVNKLQDKLYAEAKENHDS